MKLEKASNQAIKYACIKFHYAKSIPVNVLGFSVFNKKNEWCGVVLYGTGANNNLSKAYLLPQGSVIELVRMALNGKQESTSKALSLSLKLLKKYVPLCRLIVSYADKDQNHTGIIYQATNWTYTGTSMKNKHDSSWIIKNKRYHGRVISDWIKKSGGLKGLTREQFIKKNYDNNAKAFITKGKLKYIYPIDKTLKYLCDKLGKPYPKKAIEVHELNTLHSSKEVGGANPTQSLKKNLN